MVPRFSLYREMDHWQGDIIEDPAGRWVKWKDVESYVEFCYTRPEFTSITPQPQPEMTIPMYGRIEDQVELFNEDDLLEDEEVDLYDLVTKRREPTEEV